MTVVMCDVGCWWWWLLVAAMVVCDSDGDGCGEW